LSSVYQITEGISSRVMHSSVSISEGKADADLEGLAGQVVELEELFHEKEAIVGAEIDHLRETSSPNSSQSQNIHGRDIVSSYHIKVCHISLSINTIFSILICRTYI